MQSFEAKKLVEQKKKQLWRIKTLYLPIYGILSVSLFVTLLLFASSLLGTWNIEVKDTNWFVVFFWSRRRVYYWTYNDKAILLLV